MTRSTKKIIKKIFPPFIIIIIIKLNNLKKRLKRKGSGIYNILTKPFRRPNDKILLIPSATLNGGFGDDLMVTAFLEEFKDKNITIYCENVVKRKDLFDEYENIDYLSWNVTPKYDQYKGGVFLLGADNMTDAYGLDCFLFKCKVLDKSNKFNIRTAILGFSFNQNISLNVKRSLIKLLPDTIFNLREEDSYVRARKFLPDSNIKLVADIAFLCSFKNNEDEKYLLWIRKQKENDRTVIGVCPNALQAEKVGKKKYLEQFIFLLQYINNKYKVSFALLYHDLRSQCDNLSDKDLSKEIFILLNEISSFNVFYSEDIINGIQLKSYLEMVDCTVTGRMHLGISGYSLGKPMLGIAYEGKFTGLQKLFEIDVEKSIINYTELNKSKKIVDLFMSNLDFFSASVQRKLPTVLKMSMKNF
jgi:polysaccharide pyruvyl transferase WcaK-like protein